jgi:exodeoxyribonuclease-5
VTDETLTMSADQIAAVDKIRTWFKTPHAARRPVFQLCGYAGTGKTSVVAKAVQDMNISVIYATLTGKAASVLRAHGMPAMTLHSLLYRARFNSVSQEVTFRFNPQSAAGDVALIVVDESSMVGPAVGSDLMRFDTPVLALGDPGQLPPVDGRGFFSSMPPDVVLTTIHRQAADNPILHLATQARTGEAIPLGRYGTSEVILGADIDEGALWSADQVLVGTNTTKDRLNSRARAYFNMHGPVPQFGEKLVCLRNNYKYGVMNGEMFSVVDCTPKAGGYLSMTLATLDRYEPTVVENVPVMRSAFDPSAPAVFMDDVEGRTVRLAYGYAITVHKAQGSQWDHPVVIDESRVFRDAQTNWLYTAITRAAEKVTVVRGKV